MFEKGHDIELYIFCDEEKEIAWLNLNELAEPLQMKIDELKDAYGLVQEENKQEDEKNELFLNAKGIVELLTVILIEYDLQIDKMREIAKIVKKGYESLLWLNNHEMLMFMTNDGDNPEPAISDTLGTENV